MKRFISWLGCFLIVGLIGVSGEIAPPVSAQSGEISRSTAQQGRPLTPAGELVLDAKTGQPAVGALPLDFVRSPDATGPDGGGRYLIAVNSGFGIQFNDATNRAQQSLAVIDLAGKPGPKVIQNVYFPSPQSAQVGVVFDPSPDETGSYMLYVSGGVENKIWIFRFKPGEAQPLSPPSPGPDTKVTAPSFSIAGFTNAASSPRYNQDLEPVYPLGLALDDEARTLFVANNLADNLGIVRDLAGSRRLERVDLRGTNKKESAYPYGVVFVPAVGSRFDR